MERSPRSIDRIVEEQVERWRVERMRAEAHPQVHKPLPVVAISRQYGARGAAVGHRVAEKLGCSYWNRELVEEIARNADVSDRLVRFQDERHEPGIVETVRGMIRNGGSMSASDYHRELVRVVQAIAVHGTAVLIGRGVTFMVAREGAVSVRVVCPLEDRVRGLVERRGISEAEARAEIAEFDAERRAFIRDHYNSDAEDPSCYDLHVNTGTMTIDQCAEVVVAAYRARVPGQQR